MIRSFRLLTGLCLILATTACSPETAPPKQNIPREGFGGIWVMNLGQKTFVVLTLEKTGEGFAGTLSRPDQFQTANGRRFSRFSPDVTTETVVSGSIEGDRLHFVTRNAKDQTDKREYDMTLAGPNTATVMLKDTPIEPWSFMRAEGDALPVVSTDWDPKRSYSLDDNAVSNSEMQRIFDEDQGARKDSAQFARDLEAVGRQDDERRSRTRKLLADGQLHTAEDFTRAAFIFQHGRTPDDFLLAHTLAMVAAAKGDEDALWIGTATLDRYLQSTGKPQIFGTQIKEKADHTATLEPYNRALVSDVLRRELGVQPLAVQQEQLQQWTEQFKTAAAEKGK